MRIHSMAVAVVLDGGSCSAGTYSDALLEARAGVMPADVGAVEVLQGYSVTSVCGVEWLVSAERERWVGRGR